MLTPKMKMLRWPLIFFAISAVPGVLQFTTVPARPAEISTLLSLAFLIPFIAFVVFELFANDSPESDSNATQY